MLHVINLRWLLVSIVAFALDQASKHWAQLALNPHEPVAVMPFFDLYLTYNTGAAFSFLHDADGWQRWFFVAIAVIVSGVLGYLLLRLPKYKYYTACVYAMLIGGAWGNVYDRLRYGHVVDFIDWHVGAWHWPAFNIADAVICVAVGLLLIEDWVIPKKEKL